MKYITIDVSIALNDYFLMKVLIPAFKKLCMYFLYFAKTFRLGLL